MIVENKTVIIKITGRNQCWYQKHGYDAEIGQYINVDVCDLISGSSIRVDVKCDYCGIIVTPRYKDYCKSKSKLKQNKYACVKCRQRKTSENNAVQRRTDLYNRALDYCDEMGYTIITPISDINNSDSRVEYNCPIHGINETKIYTLLSRHGCLKCSYEYRSKITRITSDECEELFKSYNTILLNKDDYTGWNDKNLKVICKNCNEVFYTSYGAFKHAKGQLCPICSGGISHGEYMIKKYCEDNNIIYYTEHTFDDCKSKNVLRFDFYLPQYNICIEYQGKQHYEVVEYFGGQEGFLKRQKHDNIKVEYCKNHNITLLTIPYWEYDNIESILNKFLFA